MTGRRNPFETSEPAPSAATPPSIYDSLRVATPRQRNRRWEKNHQTEKVVYRGIDPRVALQVKTIAGNLQVPEGEVARAVIEHALRAYAEGDLSLDPRPNPSRLRMTLYPSSTGSPKSRAISSLGKRKHPEAQWRVITTWRGFPAQLKHEISALASQDGLDVPIGELVSALLRHGLKAYETGLLKLEPVERVSALTLTHGGKE